MSEMNDFQSEAAVVPLVADTHDAFIDHEHEGEDWFGTSEFHDHVNELVLIAQTADDEETKIQALGRIAHLTHDKVLQVAHRYARHPEEADDIAQEVHGRVWRGIHTFRGDAKFSTWLHRIAQNEGSRFAGKSKRHDRHERIDETYQEETESGAYSPTTRVVDWRVSPEENAEQADLRDRLKVALEALSPALRQVVILRGMYDMRHQEIAETLGISVSASKVRFHRGIKELRDTCMKDLSDYVMLVDEAPTEEVPFGHEAEA